MKRSRLGVAALAAVGGLAAALVLGASSANADIIFTLGNHPQQGENVILFSNPTSGTTVFGEVDHSGVTVQFNTLTGETLNQGAAGQADIANLAGTPLTSIEVSVPGYTFLDFILNLVNGTGTAHVLVTDNFGVAFDYDLGNGENFLTLTVENGESISDIKITGTGSFGFANFRQPRISGVCSTAPGGACVPDLPPTEIPEPASLILLGSALVGFGLIRRRLGGRARRI